MHFDEQTILHLIRSYGYVMIAGLTIVSSLGVPVPEETTVILAGWSAHEGVLSYPGVLVVCACSAIIGDNLGYWIGRTGGHALLERYGRYVGITRPKITRFHLFYQRFGALTVFFARFIAGLRFLSGPLSGSAQMSYYKFLPFNALGVVIWATIMTQLGFHFGGEIIHVLERGKWVVLGVAAAVVIGLIARAIVRGRRAKRG